MDTKEWDSFGEYLTFWREKAGIPTQAKFAKLIGTSPQNVSNWVRGREHSESGAPPKPSLDLALKIAEVLSRPADEVLNVAGLVSFDNVAFRANPEPIEVLAMGAVGGLSASRVKRAFHGWELLAFIKRKLT